MTVNTRTTILTTSKKLFATNGYEGFSIRILAKECGIGISSIYHFFKDKDEILEIIYKSTNKELGEARKTLPVYQKADEMFFELIKFQFTHIEDVVFVLKYYLHFRPNFLKLKSGFLPNKGYLHIEEILVKGVQSGEFTIKPTDIAKESKVIAHAINGFLLEYYPDPPVDSELDEVVGSIHRFILRSLTNKEAIMS